MKTRDEVEKLKRDWLKDPCYDLSPAPEGFEEYADELRQFHKDHCEERHAIRLKDAATISRVGKSPAFRDSATDGLTKLEWMAATIAAGLTAWDARSNEIANEAVDIAKELILRLAKE